MDAVFASYIVNIEKRKVLLDRDPWFCSLFKLNTSNGILVINSKVKLAISEQFNGAGAKLKIFNLDLKKNLKSMIKISFISMVHSTVLKIDLVLNLSYLIKT